MNDDFTDKLIEMVEDDVKAVLEKSSAEELRSFVRAFVLMCAKHSEKTIDMEENPLQAAAAAMYMAKLFPQAFSAAYNHTDKMLKAEQSLRKALEDS